MPDPEKMSESERKKAEDPGTYIWNKETKRFVKRDSTKGKALIKLEDNDEKKVSRKSKTKSDIAKKTTKPKKEETPKETTESETEVEVEEEGLVFDDDDQDLLTNDFVNE
jgi:hypothetical protein